MYDKLDDPSCQCEWIRTYQISFPTALAYADGIFAVPPGIVEATTAVGLQSNTQINTSSIKLPPNTNSSNNTKNKPPPNTSTTYNKKQAREQPVQGQLKTKKNTHTQHNIESQETTHTRRTNIITTKDLPIRFFTN
jgi:hypothetical protein